MHWHNLTRSYRSQGHVFRIISCLNQVLFACNNAYCINEKKAIKLLETFEYKPKKYAERVNHIFEVLGLSYLVFRSVEQPKTIRNIQA